MDLLADLTIVLLAALGGGFLAKRLGQPLIVGYILAGVLIARFTSGLMVANAHNIEQLAELGVALLLFSLGLELSFRDLAPVRTVALAGATIQIVLTIALGAAMGLAFGWEPHAAVWFGALISLSSTMVALKTIQAQGRLGTLSSRVMLGLLVVQDLAVVPLIILLPELSEPGAQLWRVLPVALRAFGLLAVIVVVATRVVPRLLASVARWNSRELFLLATTTLALGVGYLTWRLGLSLAIGAFVAGLVVNESEYAHQALSDIAPLRDLFAMLFFVSVGMLLDPALLWQHLGMVAIVVTAVLLGKAAILSGVVRLFGYRNVVPFAVGLTLFQVGEFAFVLAREGLARGAISHDLYALTLNTVIATMAMTPAIPGLTPRLYARFRPKRPVETLQPLNLPAGGLSDHVIIAGSGRVGRSIADALFHLQLPYLLVEIDDRRVQRARDDGRAVIYGDASQAVVLEAAEVHRARAMLITVPAFSDVRGIVFGVKAVRADLPIIARADGPVAIQALYAAGIQEVTSPEFEAAIEMTRQALLHLNVPANEILQVASAIRREQYGLGGTGLAVMSQIADVARQLEFTWMGLPARSAFLGRTIGELRIRTTLGASVVGLIREGRLTANPDPAAQFEPGDLIAVLGTRDQIARFESAARGADAGGPGAIARGPGTID
jgi:CPA2 family monovalent cation:H+ antiporter-2